MSNAGPPIVIDLIKGRLSSAPQFTILGTTFTCWIVENGNRYEWHTDPIKYTVGRNTGAMTTWASIDGEIIGDNFKSLKTAMVAAITYEDILR
jgi:hypothetical protein